MPAMPDNSVAKFGDNGSQEQLDADQGENYQDPDAASEGNEPAVMITQAQADAAGMSGAMPGDRFTLTVTVASQNDDGWNLSLDPQSAMKEEGPSEDAMTEPRYYAEDVEALLVTDVPRAAK